jgi:predicted transcriptional regulator
VSVAVRSSRAGGPRIPRSVDAAVDGRPPAEVGRDGEVVGRFDEGGFVPAGEPVSACRPLCLDAELDAEREGSMVAGAYEEELRGYLGPLELQIMSVVWERRPSTVKDVLDALNAGRRKPLAYNTVMTTLARLADKGFLERHRTGRAYVYSGEGPEEFLRARATEATRDLVEGLGEVAVAGIVDGLAARPGALELMRRRLERDRLGT